MEVADFSNCDGQCGAYCVDGYSHPRLVSDLYAEVHGAPLYKMTVVEILEEINRDRSPEWTDYDASDWVEGMNEFTTWRITENSIYQMQLYTKHAQTTIQEGDTQDGAWSVN